MFSAAAAAIFRLLVGLRLTDGIGREELVHRKSDVPEEPAGVLGGAAAALLLRHAVVIDRDQELRIPLQPDDGELPQGHIDPAAIPAGAETALKAVVDESRDLRQLRLTAAVFPAAAVPSKKSAGSRRSPPGGHRKRRCFGDALPGGLLPSAATGCIPVGRKVRL